MKRIIIVPILLIFWSQSLFGQSVITDSLYEEQWYTKDFTLDGKLGISLDSARYLMTGKTHQPVVVAVIDAGVDITHPDLKDQLWTHPGEIAGNAIDDDGNGYIDDVHGWNFLGNDKGENVSGDNLELTRLYKLYSTKYYNNDPQLDGQADSAEYQLSLKVKEDYEKRVEEAESNIEMYTALKEQMIDNIAIVEKALRDKPFTYENVKGVRSIRPKVLKAKKIVQILYFEISITPESLDHGIESEKSTLDTKLNTEISPRSIVGDNELDINDSIYGNNDYNGGTANHGTSVAGIIAAESGNGLGIAGICPSAQIMILRVVPGGDEHDKDVALAIRYAVNQGAQVINCSFGKQYSPQKWMVDDAIRYAQKHGVLVVHAAGNDSENNDEIPHYPSKFDLKGTQFTNMVDVAASTSQKGLYLPASFTNYGKNQVDFFAPGVSIMTTTHKGGYGKPSGTSVAAPVVSGIAALLLSYYPQLTPEQIIQLLHESALVPDPKLEVRQPGSKSTNVPISSLVITPGVVNAYQALKLAQKKY